MRDDSRFLRPGWARRLTVVLLAATTLICALLLAGGGPVQARGQHSRHYQRSSTRHRVRAKMHRAGHRTRAGLHRAGAGLRRTGHRIKKAVTGHY